METERSLSLNRQQLADMLRAVVDQLEAGGAVKSEALGAEVNPQEPIFVKLEYEEKTGQKEIEINVHLVETVQPPAQTDQF